MSAVFRRRVRRVERRPAFLSVTHGLHNIFYDRDLRLDAFVFPLCVAAVSLLLRVELEREPEPDREPEREPDRTLRVIALVGPVRTRTFCWR